MQVRRCSDTVMPARSREFFDCPLVVPHLVELMSDMGLPAVRSSNFIAENLLPVWPTRYRTLAEERPRARNRRAGRFYLSAARAAGVVLIVALWWMLH